MNDYDTITAMMQNAKIEFSIAEHKKTKNKAMYFQDIGWVSHAMHFNAEGSLSHMSNWDYDLAHYDYDY